jgi:hypothetical protein
VNTIHSAALCAMPASTVTAPDSRRRPSTIDKANDRGDRIVEITTASVTAPAVPRPPPRRPG